MVSDSRETSKRRVSLKVARVLGIVLTIACCWYVYEQLRAQSSELPLRLGNLALLGTMLFASLIVVFMNTLLAIGWRSIGFLIGGKVQVVESISLSYRTQIAKYLPGNVFHVVGRVMLVRKDSMNKGQATFATAMEAFVLLAMVFCLSASLLWTIPYFSMATSLALGVSLICAFVFRRRIQDSLSRFNISLISSRGDVIRHALLVVVCYLSVLLLQAGMFIVLQGNLAPSYSHSFMDTLEMVSLSWAAGFVVVGSPGGVGVRETVFALFAANSLERFDIALIASCMRISSVFGDFLSFLIAFLIDRFLSRGNGNDLI